MTSQGRREYLGKIYDRYHKVARPAKHKILHEFCEVTGYNRKYAVRLLNGPYPRSVRRRSGRRTSYGQDVIDVLVAVWKAAGYPCSIRLKALLPGWLPWARKRLKFTAETERQVLTISPRQIDRRLQRHKRDAKRRLYGRTKPGTLLKHHIPLRVERWNTTEPGFTEVDLVSHSGECAEGDFIHSFNLTDIHTTWVETRAVLGKAQVRVSQALEEMRQALPFRLRGIDSDNGSEFINAHLVKYCGKHDIYFTRGRPYKKDDNAHIEQKNWTHVRKLMGYVRYDTLQAFEAINDLYRHELRLLQNLFLPSVKLIRKERIGSRTRRVYDAPQTPLERLLACEHSNSKQIAELRTLRDRLDPFTLSATVDAKLARIHALATNRRAAASTNSAPKANHPWRQGFKRARI